MLKELKLVLTCLQSDYMEFFLELIDAHRNLWLWRGRSFLKNLEIVSQFSNI